METIGLTIDWNTYDEFDNTYIPTDWGTTVWTYLWITCPECHLTFSVQGVYVNFCPACGYSFLKDRNEMLKERLNEVERLLKEIKEMM